MLDRKFILDNAELVQTNCQNRGVDTDVSEFVQLENERKEIDREIQQLNQAGNENSKKVRQAEGDEKQAIIAEGRRIRE